MCVTPKIVSGVDNILQICVVFNNNVSFTRNNDPITQDDPQFHGGTFYSSYRLIYTILANEKLKQLKQDIIYILRISTTL